MTDNELDEILKAARAPELEPEDAEALARRVVAELRSAPRPTTRIGFPFIRLAWGAGVVFACLACAMIIHHERGKAEPARFADLMQNTTLIRETLALFPNQVRAIVQNEKGIEVVLADKPNVPGSTPLYVRIEDGKRWTSAVTFSGQDLVLAGQAITVLSDGAGGIILEGDQFAWSGTVGSTPYKGLHIHAKPLEMGVL